MDFIQKSGVKIPNSVIISGITQVASQDELVINFLKHYDNIERCFSVDDSLSKFHQNLIVEYYSGSAIESLEPQLPSKCTAHNDPTVVYEISTLSSVYTAQVGHNVTEAYLA